MVAANKIDSNVTGLRIAEETDYKVLPVTPTWLPFEPNSYSDFGGQLKTVAREPINDGRQRKKGVVTDLDAAGGFQSDLTQDNLQSLLQGFFFADLRKKAEFSGSVVAASGAKTLTATGIGTGLAVGDLVFVSGYSDATSNGLKTLTAVASGVITTSEALASETATAKVVRVGRKAAAGDLDVDVTGALPKLTSTTLDFTTLGIIPGEFIFVGGDAAGTKFTNAANNGFKRVRAVAANALTFDKSDAEMVLETSTTETIQLFFGRVLKNEVGALIKRRTYQLERTLGVPDTASPSAVQAQYLTGAVANQCGLKINTADKITAELSFVAAQDEQRLATDGLKTGNRPVLSEGNAFNTSSDVSRIRMAVVSDTTEAPTPLFAFVTDLGVNVDNGVSPNKAVGVLGAFDVTAGMFSVSGSLTAYFSTVAAVSAVRANADVTLDVALVKDNSGIVIDLPLLSLGNARLNVEKDRPITLPISMDAASGAQIDANLNHTLMMVFFDYLPTAADL